MSHHPSIPLQPGREFDVRQIIPEMQLLVSNEQAGGQDVLLREFHCDYQNYNMVVPAFMEDLLIIQTTGQCEVQGRIVKPLSRQPMISGDGSIVPKGVLSEWRVAGSIDIQFLYISPTLLATVAIKTLDMDPNRIDLREQPACHDPLIYAVGLALRNDIVAGGLAGRLYAESLTHTLAIHLLHDYAVFPLEPPRLTYDLSGPMLRRVIDYIQANLDQDLTLAEIANVVYLSPYHLTRLFKRATGQSIHQYVITQRVAAAQRLITAGRLPLATIAAQVGFSDQSHLTRHFKRLRGIPPAVFMKQCTNLQESRTNLQDLSPQEE